MTNYIGALAKPMGRRSAMLPLLASQLYTFYLGWRRRRRDQTALMRQPDYLLRDIGIERHEIEPALRGRMRSC
ncbi:DUF1127 domain-containing protein [Dongia sp. agr-C8]